MTTITPFTRQDWAPWLFNPLALAQAAQSYATDAWQRTLLYADVQRQRGNQYQAHLREQVPNVLDFPAELVMSGLTLPRPVNYGLVRILPPEGAPTVPDKRPFMVVDPRAGHGPGIGGFKPDSEIGAALKEGHPCYFVGFLPDPVPGQTIEDVMRAEAAFLRKVAELHPQSIGKPAVIGNCQAGWQVLMTAAVWPELFGPIILAGAPLSYWAGTTPMRYGGGLLGGSWLTALTSDAGAGRFDGAWLVQNFENLNPANTLWTKQYNVYANVDTEGPRYLEFEKYWGGHVFLNGVEMQYIVDNLFIGNKLTTAELSTSDGVRIDLRNVRSPIVVFCSYGDNITPPPQALGWITDLYRDDEDVTSHDQTIVFATHDSIGHLGIFVSGSVGRKEHMEFAANIDIIDMLPAGIYRAEVEDNPERAQSTAPDAAYLMKIRTSSVEEVRGIVQPDAASDRRFAAAARVSEMNLALYRNTAQPWVQALSNPAAAHWLQTLHPLRVGFECWSDRHPLAGWLATQAQLARANREPVAEGNPFLQAQTAISDAIVAGLNRYRDARDAGCAMVFEALYGSPAVQGLAAQSLRDVGPVRKHPGDTPEHRAFMANELAHQQDDMSRGGLPEAVVRGLTFIFQARGESDERHFRHAWEVLRPHLSAQAGTGGRSKLAEFRQLARRQALLLTHDSEAALAAIPGMLANVPAEHVQQAMDMVTEMTEGRADPLSAQEHARLVKVRDLFGHGGAALVRAPHAPAVKTATVSPAGTPTRAARQRAPSAPRASTPAPRRRAPRTPG